MNKRIVLIDREETKDYARYYGSGLGNDIYVLDVLDAIDPQKKMEILTLGEGDAAMLVGAKPFTYLKQYYHFGVRSENYFDCSKLFRLSIEGGAFIKEVLEFPGKSVIDSFMSPEFTVKVEFPGVHKGILHTFEEAMGYIDYLDKLPLDTYIGLDYEASGMPLDKWFELSGVSIATTKIVGFISFTDIRHTTSPENYNKLLKRLGEFIMKRMTHIVVYNMQYEYQVSHRMLGIDAYDLLDASVVNIVEGYHLKKYSLKWTGQRVLGVNVWDAEFDRISDLVDQMLFRIEGKTKKDQHKILRVDKNTFDQTPEWAELMKRYSKYEAEFRALILEYWGNAFMCIPSEILGFYCNLDAFYTLMIWLKEKPKYQDDCWDAFLNNIRLGCRLMSGGLYIDEPLRLKYDHYAHQQMAWGITYCAMARCYMKIKKHESLAGSTKRYKPITLRLIQDGDFYNGNITEITKNLLLKNLDTMDSTATGLNEGGVLMKYGPEFADFFVGSLKDSMAEIKFKGKIDDTVARKKKLISTLSGKLAPFLGLDKLKIGPKTLELEKLYYYQRAYNELKKVTEKQLPDINHIPDTIYAFGQKFNLLGYSSYVSDNYFKCKSPIENDELVRDYYNLYKTETSYLAALSESTNQLTDTSHFYETRGITNIVDGLNEFGRYFTNYFNTGELGIYPEKMYTLFNDFYTNGVSKTGAIMDEVKNMWIDFKGYNAQSTYFPGLNNDFLEYEKKFDPSDYDNSLFFMRKFTLNYLLYKKYAKIDSTYIGDTGMFKKNNKIVLEDERHIPIREVDPTEPGAIEKCFVHYEVMSKSSKRWSSGFHTIISHSDLKNCITVPPTRNEDGSLNYGGGDYVLSYFDISSAEVKSAGFASADPGLIEKFNEGVDIYIYTAKLYYGEDGWNALDKKRKKKVRKQFKTVFLGILYGLGKNSLAQRLECSVQEAENIIQSVYKAFPKLREYVDRQGNYPIEHDGYINTYLGDTLRLVEWTNYLPKAKSDRERNNIIARIKRLGVNLPVQGGTSTIMSKGFFNNIRVSIQEGWKNPLQPIITVHDSNTNIVPTEKIFDMRKFYDKNYTMYLKGVRPHIMLLFDLLVGTAYEYAKTLEQIDDDTIQFTGDCTSLLKLYDKIMNCKKLKVECNMTREELVNGRKMITDPMQRFIMENGCSLEKDVSTVDIRFHRVR